MADELASSGDPDLGQQQLLRRAARVDALAPDQQADELKALVTGARQLLERGQRPVAQAILNQAAQHLHASSDRPLLALTLGSIAVAYMQTAEYHLALIPAIASVQLELQLTGTDPESPVRARALLGLCYGLLGDLDTAEKHLSDAHAHAMRLDNTRLRQVSANNLVFATCMAADRLRLAGHDAQARAALWRLAPHVSLGESLPSEPGSFLQTTWRANRAGWLRRIGRTDEARPEYDDVYQRALAGDWVDVARHAALGLGLLALESRQADEAVPWLVRCIAVSEAMDACGFVSEAHSKLAGILAARGDGLAAERHRRHSALTVDALHNERRRVKDALSSVEFDVRRALDADQLAHMAEEVARLGQRTDVH